MNKVMISLGGIIIVATIVMVSLIPTFSVADFNNKNTITKTEINTEKTDNPKQIQSDGSSLQDSSDDFMKTYQCKGKAKCFSGIVARIIDGDTIVVDDNSIRFSLVNTPEWGDDDYFQARNYIANLCPIGSQVRVDEDDGQTQRSFGRIIGKIFCNGVILNEEILESGHAVILTNFCPVSEFANESWAKKFGC